MRVIFVPVADRPECAVALNTAFEMGSSLGASIIGCHIRAHTDAPAAQPLSLSLLRGATAEAEWYAALKSRDVKKELAAAKRLFTGFAEKYDYEFLKRPGVAPGAVWVEKVGSPDKVIGIMGPVADLLVVSRPPAKGGALARLFLTASLLRSHRPVLVLPQKKKSGVGKRVCIAWNQSGEAAQAVAAALPILAQADRVSIVTCGPQSRPGPKSGQLAAYLKYWGIQSTHVSTPGKDEGREIVAAYEKTDSDLIVMGAYSRSRMSQMVFGGMTEYMLRRSSIPVFMVHT